MRTIAARATGTSVETVVTSVSSVKVRELPKRRGSASTSPGEDGAAGLAEKVYRHVIGCIRTGKLSPNARLTQRGLSAELKVSQVVVREAFERLEQQGWIERKRNRFAAVKAFTEKDRFEVYWIREMIEVSAVRHIAEHATKEQLKQLKEVLEALNRACEQNQVEAYHEADITFHTLLVQFVGNDRLNSYYETISEQIHQLMVIGALKVAFHWTQSCEVMEAISHEKIYQAIVDRDADLAGELLRRHIQMGGEVIELVNRARTVS
jgi:DNA-binding GntR family transcriptional regulator